MSQHHNHSPSKLGTMTKDRCQGRAREEATWPDLDLGSGDAGNDLHLLTKRIIYGERKRSDALAKPSGELAIIALDWLDAKLATFRDDYSLAAELRMPVWSNGHVITEGEADLVILTPAGIHVIDWKFGPAPLDDVTARVQVMCYAVGAMQLLRRDRADAWLYQPALDVEYHVEFELWAALREIESIIDAASRPDAPLVAGDWCRYCNARVGCPAVREAGGVLAALLADHSPLTSSNGNGTAPALDVRKKVLRARFDGQFAQLAARGAFAQIDEIAQLATVVEPASEAARAAIKQLMLDGYAEHFAAGWRIIEKSNGQQTLWRQKA